MKAFAVTFVSLITITACGSATTARVASTPAAVASAGAALSCKLPIGGFVLGSPKGQPDNSIASDGFPNQKGTGGFLDLPGGAYTPVADSDRAYETGAWLPVLPQAIATDKLTYAATRGPSLYVVAVRTRAERLVHAWPAGVIAQVLAYTSAGIYVQTVSGGQAVVTQLQLVQPDTGAVQPVAGANLPAGSLQLVWSAISDGAAWGQLVTLKGSAPDQVPQFALVRLDLGTHDLVKWYDAAAWPMIGGFDPDGRPLVSLVDGASASKVVLLTAPNQPLTIEPQGGTYLAGRPSIVSDSHGAWFGSADGGIWLYTTAGVFEKVATIPPLAGDSGQPFDPHAMRSVAGPCK